jgi:uncharacterized membrane protein
MQQTKYPQIGQPLSRTEKRALVVAGSLLSLYGLRRRSLMGALISGLGLSLVYRGLTGASLASALKGSTARNRNAPPWRRSVRIQRSVSVRRPRAETYRFWRNLDNLPAFMTHLEEVLVLDSRRSRWIAKAPAGMQLAWDAEITGETEGERIAWKSLAGSDVQNAGSVRFSDTPDGRGTEIHISLEYVPPAGELGAAVMKLLGEDPDRQIDEDLQRLKRLLESGRRDSEEGGAYVG